MPEISVIVPVYQVEPYLCRCVDSILSQTFRDFELILVNDGSPDNCGAICEEYARRDDRIHVIHQKNGGLSAARNAAIDWAFQNSSSRWFTFIDSDDWVHERMLEILLTMAREKNVNISVCGFVQTRGEEPDHIQILPAPRIWTPEAFYVSCDTVPVIACAKLYRRECFRDIRYPVGKVHEDEYTTYRLLFPEKQIVVSEAPLYFYFQNEAGITKSGWSPKRLDAVQALGEQVAYFRKNGFQKAYQRICVWYAVVLIQQRKCVEQSDLPEPQKQNYIHSLTRDLRRAGWEHAGVYLWKEPFLYTEIFPGLYRIYRKLRGKEDQ